MPLNLTFISYREAAKKGAGCRERLAHQTPNLQAQIWPLLQKAPGYQPVKQDFQVIFQSHLLRFSVGLLPPLDHAPRGSDQVFSVSWVPQLSRGEGPVNMC